MTNSTLVFTAESIKNMPAAIKALEKRYPALDRISVSLSVGVPENVALEQLDRFAKEVMPAFKGAKAPRPMLVR